MRRNRRSQTLVEQLKLRNSQLDIARGEFWVRLSCRPFGYLPRDLDHVLSTQQLAFVDDLIRRIRRIEYHLCYAIAVTKVDKHPSTMIAKAIDPSAKGDFR